MLAAEAEHSFVRAIMAPLDAVPEAALDAARAALAADGQGALAAEGYGGDAASLRFAADLRYLGQSSELTVPVAGPLDAGISPVGNATSVVHSLAADGALNSLIRFDRRTGRLDMTAFLDNATRRLLFRQVQP